MKHIFKISLQYSDLLIHAIDGTTITSQAVEKDSAKPLTSLTKDKYETHGGQIHFLGGYSLPIDLAKHITQTLNS